MKNSNTSMELMVKSFHEKYGHLVNRVATVDVPEGVVKLRKILIEEEYAEMILGIEKGNIQEIADGAADLMYVVIGTCISYGIPIERIFREVHRSNMTKTAIKAESGEKYGTKTPKGPDYIAPDIKGILEHPENHTTLELKSK